MTRRTLPISWEEVCSRRLERHGLSSRFETAGPADVAQAICGSHAQVMSAAELSIGLRLANATRDDVRAALWEERTLVKTFGPRGTVHLLPTRDLPMWTAALSQVPQVGGHAKDVRMTPEQTDQVVKAIAAAVEAAELTIDELSDEVVARTGPWAGDLVMPAFQGMWPRWRQALGTAGRRGAVCFGPDRGRKVTYTHPRRWLPGFRPADLKEALPELVRHYLRAFGPATPEHFANWIGGPPPWAAELFEARQLPRADPDGNELW